MQQQLGLTLKVSFALFALGTVIFFLSSSLDKTLWFTVGGGLALMNLFFAVWVARQGLHSNASKGVFLGLIMIKSFTFLLVIAGILVFLKPALLPFTLGVGIVIFGSVLAALGEVRKLRRL